jgi:hypothetical protein
MLRNPRTLYRVARSAGHSVLHALGFALFNLRPPAVRRQIDDENHALLIDLKRKLDEGTGHDRDAPPPPPPDAPGR